LERLLLNDGGLPSDYTALTCSVLTSEWRLARFAFLPRRQLGFIAAYDRIVCSNEAVLRALL